MALTFGFTNTTASTKKIELDKLGMFANYSPRMLHDDKVDKNTGKVKHNDSLIYDNSTCPTDLQEFVSYRAKQVPVVENNLTINNPAKVKNGLMYSFQTETAARETVSAEDGVIYDYPIKIYTTIVHPQVGAITADVINALLERHMSSIFKDDGTSRIPDLMRLCTTIKAD